MPLSERVLEVGPSQGDRGSAISTTPVIERIVIRDVATHGYEGVTFDNLQLANFIYGGNNCDKTSLSRTLACTEPEKDYLNCEIHLTTKLTQTLEDGGQATVPNLKINILQNYSLAAA